MATTEQMKNAENMIVQALGSVLPDTKQIREFVYQFSSVLTSSQMFDLQPIELEILIRNLETRFVTTMDPGVVLTDPDIPHDEEWYQRRSINWAYWEDYRLYLGQQRWSPRVIQSLDTISDRILGLLCDPHNDGEWERRGLVIGHVQSGKTANYLGVISKAADAGYKFIIIIAGIHNELRRQTQARIEEGFIGRNQDENKPVGVGLIRPARATPVTVTTQAFDFNPAIGRRFNLRLTDLNKTFILVIKKNISALTSLYTWLRDLNTRAGFERITDIPMLMVDDEADNASVNTSRPELDPTRINREIRGILCSVAKIKGTT